jgi:hypothetical protein
MLGRIGVMLPHLGDPYLIPLAHIPIRYRQAEDVRRWKLGIDETEEQQAERVNQRRVRKLKRAMRQGV